MIDDLATVRRFFAEELEMLCNLRPCLVEAFATVRREDFVGEGPWTVWTEASLLSGARMTPDAHPRRVYHNVPIAIDPGRQLFNGQPGTIGLWMEKLGIDRGSRVLHVGCGLGYYTAVMAECVGSTGRVLAIEVDQALAAAARENLAPWPSVDVRHGDATERFDEEFDAVLVNAGATHPLPNWLDALAPHGRLALPLTCALPAMGSTIGKGIVVIVNGRGEGQTFAVRPLAMVAIYSGVGVRNDAMNERLGRALANPSAMMSPKRLRLDAHEQEMACWFHGEGFCFQSVGADRPLAKPDANAMRQL